MYAFSVSERLFSDFGVPKNTKRAAKNFLQRPDHYDAYNAHRPRQALAMQYSAQLEQPAPHP